MYKQEGQVTGIDTVMLIPRPRSPSPNRIVAIVGLGNPLDNGQAQPTALLGGAWNTIEAFKYPLTLNGANLRRTQLR